MLPGRESQFPERQSEIRGEAMFPGASQAPVPQKITPRRRFPKAALFLIIVAVLGNLSLLTDSVTRITERFFNKESLPQVAVEAIRKKVTEAVSPPQPANPGSTVSQAKQRSSQREAVRAGAAQSLSLSISESFRPIGFVVPARSRKLPLSSQPDRLYKRLPKFQGGEQRYGVIQLAGSQQYRFVLDTPDSGFLLYLDMNRNGDLTDDGGPITNAGDGLFANKLVFSMAKVTGISGLQGDYQLWMFTNDQGWADNSMRIYAMTQLAGEVRLNGKRYKAYLADNHLLDADFTNDGMGIDIDGDGKIAAHEYMPPNGQITVDGQRYSISITR